MPVRRGSETGGCSKLVQWGRCDLTQHGASHTRDSDGERVAMGQVRDNHHGVMEPGTLNIPVSSQTSGKRKTENVDKMDITFMRERHKIQIKDF